MLKNSFHAAIVTLALLFVPMGVFAQDGGLMVTPGKADGKAYPVSGFGFSYVKAHEDHPSLDPLMNLKVPLLHTSEGYVAPRKDHPGMEMTLSELFMDGHSKTFYGSALTRVARAVVTYFNDLGLVAVHASLDPKEIDRKGRDLRDGSTNKLNILIKTLTVGRLRTIHTDKDSPEEERTNLGHHSFMSAGSPVKPSGDRDGDHMDGDADDLIFKNRLDEYIHHLNRYPMRRVDAHFSSIAPGVGDKPQDEIGLDFLVTEKRPWKVYGGASNTGTKSTKTWYERVGFTRHQLTKMDDTLSLEYSTAGFDKVHSFVGSYEAPIPNERRVRWQLQGIWSQYKADQLGILEQANAFEGDQWSVGGRVTWNFFQHKELFVDASFALLWKRVNVENKPGVTNGSDTFCLPSIGVSFLRNKTQWSVGGSMDIEWNWSDLAGTAKDPLILARLGRTDPSPDWVSLNYSLRGSWYLDPLFFQEGWDDTSTPETSTLAHELSMSVRGQYTSDSRRLPSQFTGVIGGFYTVRGYKQSVASGDSTLVARTEYSLHIPRLFPIEPDPSKTPLWGKPFRRAPQHVYGRPDWDLIARGFYDFGRAIKNRIISNVESNGTLSSAGVGLELVYKENLVLRGDMGWALKAYEPPGGDPVTHGSSRVHLSATLLY